MKTALSKIALLVLFAVAMFLAGRFTTSPIHAAEKDDTKEADRPITAGADVKAKDNDPFQEVVQKYLAANPKPGLPEEARKFKVQAEFAVQEKQFAKAAQVKGTVLIK